MKKLNRNRICPILLLLGCLLPLVGCEKAEELFSGTPADALRINEVVSSNQLSLVDDVYGSPDWIELYNGSENSIHLSNYYITDNVEAPQKATQLPDVILGPGEYHLLYANKKGGPNCVAFSLKKAGETLTILNAHLEEVSSLIVPSLMRDVSYARRDDGSYGYCDLPTPGQANGDGITDLPPLSSQLQKPEEEEAVEAPRSPDVLITEIVSKNGASLAADGCVGCTEWVELFNPNEVPVSLAGFTLTDDMAQTDKHNFPETEPELAPGAYLIVCCGRKACAAEGHVRIDLGLSSRGEELFLFDSNGYALDHVSFPALDDDIAWTKGSDGGWGYCLRPTPGAGNRDEDILQDLAPAAMADPLSFVHIHEVLYRNSRSILDEDGDRSDFVELKNASAAPVSLDGWYLSDNVEKLTKWPLPAVTLSPGEFLLVFLSGKDRSTGELHASFSLHAGETLVLYDSLDRRYDALTVPETEENVSVGRDDTGAIVFFSHPTPLEENGHPLATGK